jgi:hypothetical protein
MPLERMKATTTSSSTLIDLPTPESFDNETDVTTMAMPTTTQLPFCTGN